MASEEGNQDNLAEVNNQNEENPGTAEIATSDAKGEGTENNSNQQDEVEKEVKLYVGNLPDQCRRGALQELFEKYGKVSQCDIVKNFAFVHMVGEKNAKDALETLDDSEFCGTHIQVQFAKSKGKPSEDECFSCGKHGHWAKDCPRRRRFDDRRDFRRNDYGLPRRSPYDRPPPAYYDPYMDRRGGYPPSRDYYGGYQYRSRSPGRSPPRYTGFYEGYPRHEGYGSRRY